VHFKLQGVSYIVSKRHKLWELRSTNGYKLEVHFYPPYTQILRSASLPGFADGHQQTKLNQTVPNGEQ